MPPTFGNTSTVTGSHQILCAIRECWTSLVAKATEPRHCWRPARAVWWALIFARPLVSMHVESMEWMHGPEASMRYHYPIDQLMLSFRLRRLSMFENPKLF